MNRPGEIEISEATSAELGSLEPLWADMHAHHAAMRAQVAPVRPFAESWPRRRAEYEAWMGGGEGHLLVARRDGALLGYLMLRLGSGASTWDIGDVVAEVESLSVAAAARGEGVGGRLMAAARSRAHALGARRLLVSVVHANTDALRFYEREGFGPYYVTLLDGGDR